MLFRLFLWGVVLFLLAACEAKKTTQAPPKTVKQLMEDLPLHPMQSDFDYNRVRDSLLEVLSKQGRKIHSFQSNDTTPWHQRGYIRWGNIYDRRKRHALVIYPDSAEGRRGITTFNALIFADNDTGWTQIHSKNMALEPTPKLPIREIDFNFDGWKDIAIVKSNNLRSATEWYVFMYQPDSFKIRERVEMPYGLFYLFTHDLVNCSRIDHQHKRLIAHYDQAHDGKIYTEVIHKWEKYDLVTEEWHDYNYHDDSTVCIAKKKGEQLTYEWYSLKDSVIRQKYPFHSVKDQLFTDLITGEVDLYGKDSVAMQDRKSLLRVFQKNAHRDTFTFYSYEFELEKFPGYIKIGKLFGTEDTYALIVSWQDGAGGMGKVTVEVKLKTDARGWKTILFEPNVEVYCQGSYDLNNFKPLDVNFDGYPDLTALAGAGVGGARYSKYAWLFNPNKKTLTYNPFFNEIGCPIVYKKDTTIRSVYNLGNAFANYSFGIYKWYGNMLLPVHTGEMYLDPNDGKGEVTETQYHLQGNTLKSGKTMRYIPFDPKYPHLQPEKRYMCPDSLLEFY